MKLVNPQENLRSMKISGWIREINLPKGVFIIHEYNVEKQRDIVSVQTKHCDAFMTVKEKTVSKYKLKTMIEKNIDVLLEMEKNISDSD